MFNIRKFLLSLITVFFSNQAFVQALLGVVLCDVCLVLHIVGTCGLMRIGSAKVRRCRAAISEAQLYIRLATADIGSA